MTIWLSEFQLRAYAAQTAGMVKPARCTCGKVYDLGKVTILSRYLDCETWQCPGCKREINSMHEYGWSPVKLYDLLPVVPAGGWPE